MIEGGSNEMLRPLSLILYSSILRESKINREMLAIASQVQPPARVENLF